MSASESIDVAVGVIINHADQVLISLRHPDSHQGNLWEFPGGKLEQGETVETALRREIGEELGLVVKKCFPLKTIHYQYPDKSVTLHVCRITEWSGEAAGREGQEIDWRAFADLDAEDFPAANAPIVKLLQLPSLIAITPTISKFVGLHALIMQLLDQQLRLVQLRQPQLASEEYLDWFQAANELCLERDATLIFNGNIADFHRSGAKGFHANSARMMEFASRPVSASSLFSASCHNLQQLQQAESLAVDFAFLSPVAVTSKYPAERALGWQGFQELLCQVSMPVYGLGGLVQADLGAAKAAGAHGICGIGMFVKQV